MTADIKIPIIVADFLHYFSLLVDMRQHTLRDTLMQLKFQRIAIYDT